MIVIEQYLEPSDQLLEETVPSPSEFLSKVLDFNPLLDPETFEKSIEELNLTDIGPIIKDLEYLHSLHSLVRNAFLTELVSQDMGFVSREIEVCERWIRSDPDCFERLKAFDELADPISKTYSALYTKLDPSKYLSMIYDLFPLYNLTEKGLSELENWSKIDDLKPFYLIETCYFKEYLWRQKQLCGKFYEHYYESEKDLDEAKDLMHQVINKLDHDRLRKEYILSHFNQVVQESKLYNEDMLKNFWGYFKNDDELEKICIDIKKAKDDDKKRSLREIQKMLHGLEEVCISVREFEKIVERFSKNTVWSVILISG